MICSSRASTAIYVFLFASILAIPSAPLSNILTPIKAGGGIDDLIILIVWVGALLIVPFAKHERDSFVIRILTLSMLLFLAVITMTMLLNNDLKIKAVLSDAKYYLYWMGLLVPLAIGPILNWKSLTIVFSSLLYFALAISAYGMFFDSSLFLTIIGRENNTVEYMMQYRFRLPYTNVFLMPLLHLMYVNLHGTKRLKTIPLIFHLSAVCITIVLTQNRTVILLYLFVFMFMYEPSNLKNNLRNYFVGLILFSTAVFVIVLFKDGLMGPLYDRLILGAINFEKTTDGVWADNRDALFMYTADTVAQWPLTGRGLGNSYWEIGRDITKQDVSIFNHIDKSGLIVTTLYILLHFFLWRRVKYALNILKTNLSKAEYVLRLSFYRYIPLLALVSLNIDVLYGRAFVFVYFILISSIIHESQTYTREKSSKFYRKPVPQRLIPARSPGPTQPDIVL